MKKTNNKKLIKIAKKIIVSNIYMSLATCGKNPWVAPVYFCVDKKLNFYFISQPGSKHIRHLIENTNCAFAIFDSTQKEGTGNGVQGEGRVEFVKDEELGEALTWYKTTFVDLKPETFKKPNPYRMYRLTPKSFYILDPEAKVDKRIKVDL